MLLKKFRVTEFRSVEDSDWIDAENITALIGTNESGKTNVLLPLWKLNPANEGDINLQDDLPREKYHTYRNASPMPVFINAIYALTNAEKGDLSDLTGMDPDNFSEISVSKNFSGEYIWNFPTINNTPTISNDDIYKIFDEYTEALNTQKELPKEEKQRQKNALEVVIRAKGKLVNTKTLIECLNDARNELDEIDANSEKSTSYITLDELKQVVSEKIKIISAPNLTENIDVITYLKNEMPKYVYYSNYGNLDSQIYLPQVLENIPRKDLGVKESAKARTLKTLFDFVKLNPSEITELGADPKENSTQDEINQIATKKTERNILLDSASSSFTKSFNEWWKQGNYTFLFQADGDFFRIWVSDSIRPEKIELESRSTGLQWFFSFYLVFLVESDQHHQNAILLLDEPGVTLHPLAQKDLFKFFESLSEKNQILYTTHSPFMVDSDHLERVRSVYVDRVGKTVVSSDLRASEHLYGKNQTQSIYPAHAALGLTVSDTLLINCKPILVEGESDQLYLSALKSLLISEGKISPLKEIIFITTGGVKGIKSMVGILSGRSGDMPYVIVDGDIPGQKMKLELKGDFYAADTDKIIDISDYTSISKGEIEDIFPASKFAALASKFLPRPEEVEEEFEDIFETGKPICDQIESYSEKHGIQLEKGWKVRLATTIKQEILRGRGRAINVDDEEFEKIVELFQIFAS